MIDLSLSVRLSGPTFFQGRKGSVLLVDSLWHHFPQILEIFV